MNATPMNIHSSQPVQAQPPGGKQQDSAAPDVPFSQVLSSEIAQNRNNSTREGRDADADSKTRSKTTSQPAQPAEAEAETETAAAVAAAAAAAATSGGNPLAQLEHEWARASAQATAATPGGDPHALLEPGEARVSDPAAATATDDVPLALPLNTGAEALMAPAINPDPLRLTPAGTDDADAEQPADPATNLLPFQGARKGRAQLAAQAGQFADPERGAQKIDPALAEKANAQTASTAAAASAFAGRLSATLQPEALKAGEFTTDPMGHPAMRASSHVPLESLPTSNEVASSKLAPSLGTTAWNQALGEKLVWMAAGAQQTATLTLNPPNMGPLQIVLNVSNEQATASFFSAQPEVRQALESAFPRLKEMMNEAGIELGQATVSADTPQQNDTRDHQGPRNATASAPATGATTSGQMSIQSPAPHAGRGLIDTFA